MNGLRCSPQMHTVSQGDIRPGSGPSPWGSSSWDQPASLPPLWPLGPAQNRVLPTPPASCPAHGLPIVLGGYRTGRELPGLTPRERGAPHPLSSGAATLGRALEPLPHRPHLQASGAAAPAPLTSARVSLTTSSPQGGAQRGKRCREAGKWDGARRRADTQSVAEQGPSGDRGLGERVAFRGTPRDAHAHSDLSARRQVRRARR
ncbi:Hypothetical predicted protein [Marmota monax]|uniref:Uncharacterized protein n=1 Tax=Marmota monax TaxID=9995 RepID=A0A5E4C7Y2_MARMO|nr:Hypothetical predicted protein [Marmota monax]